MASLKSLVWILAMFIIMTDSALIIHTKPLFSSDNSVWPEIRETPNSLLEDYLPSFTQWIRTFEMVEEDLKRQQSKIISKILESNHQKDCDEEKY